VAVVEIAPTKKPQRSDGGCAPTSRRCGSAGSRTLTKSFIEACKSDNTSIVVDTLNVWHERLPESDYEAIGAKYKAVKHVAELQPITCMALSQCTFMQPFAWKHDLA
jgi:hypothetical protein